MRERKEWIEEYNRQTQTIITYRGLGFNASWRMGHGREKEAKNIDNSLEEIGNGPLHGLAATNGAVGANVGHVCSVLLLLLVIWM